MNSFKKTNLFENKEIQPIYKDISNDGKFSISKDLSAVLGQENQTLRKSNTLEDGERVVCPAIWIDDGKEYRRYGKYDSMPKNIDSGCVVFGLNIVDIFRRMNSADFDLLNIKKDGVYLTSIREGYFTNTGRFIEKYIDY